MRERVATCSERSGWDSDPRKRLKKQRVMAICPYESVKMVYSLSCSDLIHTLLLGGSSCGLTLSPLKKKKVSNEKKTKCQFTHQFW